MGGKGWVLSIRVPTYLGDQAGLQDTGFSGWLLCSGSVFRAWEQWMRMNAVSQPLGLGWDTGDSRWLGVK
jgi:hypothetical protein